MNNLKETKLDFTDSFGESYELSVSLEAKEASIGMVYGFSVIKTKNGEFVEAEKALNITDSLEVAKSIYKRLVEGVVTPINLCYVVDDYMFELEC